MIDLKKFCAEEGIGRSNIEKPFTKSQWTYATNGHICVRVPKRNGIEENPEAPSCEGLFQAANRRGPYKWVDVPNVKVKQVKCRDCEGTGKWDDIDKRRYDCDECGSTGKITKHEPVKFKIMGVTIALANVYLDLIKKALPNPQIGLIKDAGNWSLPAKVIPVKVRFDGGCGLLMAIW